MLIFVLLFGCAENLEKSACDAVDGDIHILTASAESGLQEPAAQFHVHLHSHTVEIADNKWIWVSGTGQRAAIYTDATISSVQLDGEEQTVPSPKENETCSESLTNVYELTLTEGIWDFQVADSGNFNWIAAPTEDDHADHDHDHDHDH